MNLIHNDDKSWLVACPSCEAPRKYTRMDHARQSVRAGWRCKPCAAKDKSINLPVGDKTRTFRRFRKSAINRGVDWALTEEEMFRSYVGRCAMTGWPLSLRYGEQTASLDRIDNERGYVAGNIQWVHAMVNMCRNKYSVERFVEMCRAVADKEKW